MQYLKAIAALLGLLTEAIQEYRRRKEASNAQARADRINVDPASDFMRRFKRGQVSADTTAGTGKRDKE